MHVLPSGFSGLCVPQPSCQCAKIQWRCCTFSVKQEKDSKPRWSAPLPRTAAPSSEAARHPKPSGLLCILDQVEDEADFIKNILLTGEAHFSRNAQINLHDAHYWSSQIPHWVLRTKNQYQWSFNVWCGMRGGVLIGPVFFNGSLTGKRYLEEILHKPVDEFQNGHSLAEGARQWFQNYGASPHAYSQVQTWFDVNFLGNWIGRVGPVPWPARSPDLTPLDLLQRSC